MILLVVEKHNPLGAFVAEQEFYEHELYKDFPRRFKVWKSIDQSVAFYQSIMVLSLWMFGRKWDQRKLSTESLILTS